MRARNQVSNNIGWLLENISKTVFTSKHNKERYYRSFEDPFDKDEAEIKWFLRVHAPGKPRAKTRRRLERQEEETHGVKKLKSRSYYHKTSSLAYVFYFKNKDDLAYFLLANQL